MSNKQRRPVHQRIWKQLKRDFETLTLAKQRRQASIDRAIQAKWDADVKLAPLTPEHRGIYQKSHEFVKRITGDFPNIVEPRSFNDHIAWLQLFDQRPEKTIGADKLAARGMIAERVGESYLPTLYGSYADYDAIDFDALPDTFVIKANHDTCSVYIIDDKTKMDHDELRRKLNRAVKRPFGYDKGEWQYLPIQPTIFVEERIGEPGATLEEYKFHNCDGRVCFVQHIWERREPHAYECLYTADFEPDVTMLTERFTVTDPGREKPAIWDELTRVALALSQDFKFLRVDIMVWQDRIVCGELTFTPTAGAYATPISDYWGKYMGFDRSTTRPPIWHYDQDPPLPQA